MSINFPTSVDNGTSLPNPSASSAPNNPSHAGLHDNENAAIIALETKLGTGASTPTNNNFLVGTGTGTSAWNKAVPTGAVVGTSDSQTLTGKTLTAPTINGGTVDNVTLTVDTVSGHTSATAVTVANLAISNGVLNTNNSVKTSNIQNAAVTADKLSTGAATAKVVTTETTTSTSYTDLSTSGPAVTVTIGANGLALVILNTQLSNGSSTGYASMSFAVSGANTQAAADEFAVLAINPTTMRASSVFLLTGLTAGSTTFTAKYASLVTGTSTFLNRKISVVPL